MSVAEPATQPSDHHEGKPDGAAVSAAPLATPVDFAERRHLTADQMKKLVSMNQPFTRSLGAHLSGWLDADIGLSMLSAERLLYRDQMAVRDPEAMYLSRGMFQGIGIPALLELELQMVDALVHLNLGGPLDLLLEPPPGSGPGGAPDGPRRELTLIDTEIMALLMATVWRELNQIWTPSGLHGLFDRRILPADVLKVFPPTEYLLTFTYVLTIDRLEGRLVLSLPTPIADTLLREIDRHDAHRSQSPEVREILRERLGQLPQRGTLRLPGFAMRLRDVQALRPGTVLYTGVPSQTRAEFSVPGGPLWQATPMKHEGRIAARLLQFAKEPVGGE